MDGDGVSKLLERIGQEDGGQEYKVVSHRLATLGFDEAMRTGVTLKLSDFSPPKGREDSFKHVDEQDKVIDSAPELSDEERSDLRDAVYGTITTHLREESYRQGVDTANPLADQVKAKARGDKLQLASILATPGEFRDARGRLIPVYPKRSYSEGLSPAEWYSASYGTRQGVIATKFATPVGGDLGKQLTLAALDLVVTSDDCGTSTGVPFKASDQDSVGSALAMDAGAYKAGQYLTPRMLKELGDSHSHLVLRSPMTCKAKGGVCAVCAGLAEDGNPHPLMSNVGIKAGSALCERVAQGSLNTKHGGGSKEKVKGLAGTALITQLTQAPSTFRYKAPVSEVCGKVMSVEVAPQGGHFIDVAGQRHYSEAGLTPLVAVGDDVEQGDVLTEGEINPSDIVRLKGVGEGRRYYAERLTSAFKDSKLAANRRNMEVVARANINHVNVTDSDGLAGWLVGDTAAYNAVEAEWKPRDDSVMDRPTKLVGKYLEEPALHYSVGTPITGKVAATLEEYGYDKALANDAPPGFEPEMIRLREAPHNQKDWMAKLRGTYLTKNLMEDTRTGATSSIHGLNPVPGMAFGAEFGKPPAGTVGY